MKFTEGYWEKNERANAQYAAQAFAVEEIENGMRVTAPLRVISDRSGALDVGTITTEFTAVRKDIISVRSYHFEGYEKRDAGCFGGDHGRRSGHDCGKDDGACKPSGFPDFL